MKLIKMILVFMMLMTIGGCSMNDLNDRNKDKATREEVKQQMLEYVEEKYDMEFECESIDYADWYNPGEEFMYVYPKGIVAENREDTFLVKRFTYKGGYKFTDGYVGYLNFPKYQEISEKIIKKYFPEAMGNMPAYFNELYPKKLTPDSTFEEFKKYTDSVLRISHSIYIGYDGELKDLENKIERLKKELSETYSIGVLFVYCYDMTYFKKEIVSGNVDLNKTDPELNTILIKRGLRWGVIDQDNPFDYYNVEEQE